MNSTLPDLSRLKPDGGKRSSKREQIVNVFLRQEGHLSADDLVDLIRREDQRISRATIYRALQWMVDAGIARKVDFGEGTPLTGQYASGRTGWYEHNLYPFRYNKAVAEITKEVSGEDVIWARSAWAGSQRYPLHWGGDAENTDSAMAAELRGGLSLGLSGFTYWSHDVGGFVARASEDLYLRWLAFGVLTSHSRCHGTTPKEPWEYGERAMKEFRRTVELKYQLMPYVYAQAKDSSERGLPMLRALFVEYPDDPGSWLVDDQYLFGSSILVAPLMDGE